MLHTEPSFSIYANEDAFLENEKEVLGIAKTADTQGVGDGEFSFGKRGMGLIVEVDENDKDDKLSGFRNLDVGEKEKQGDEQIEPKGPPMYPKSFYGTGGDIDEYYSKLVSEDPSNPLFLRNYAQLLQLKGDLTGAEEYCFRATLADPRDGGILMQYAKLVWELHHDQDRALSYFESAARAAPEDCNVLAAYASFMWEIDEDEDNDKDSGHGRTVLKTVEVEERPVSPPLYLATGLGINVDGLGSSFDYATEGCVLDGKHEEHYKKMVDQNPCNPLVLRNYAQFLRQVKGDLQGAEEYYSRAILADPEDGEVISQYAQLVWELHHDRDRALRYFEDAARAAPKDCNVLAAYANFLWQIEEDDDDCRDTGLGGTVEREVEEKPVSQPLHLANGLGVEVVGLGSNFNDATDGSGLDGKLEDYYKKMVHENPCNALVLRNYAHFLRQSKGDLQGAEEHYSRAVLADPGNGEVISQYAQLVWELHHDQDKASSYFERAVQAAPADSHVLAAYAKFLWEAEDEEYSGHPESEIQLQSLQGALTSV